MRRIKRAVALHLCHPSLQESQFGLKRDLLSPQFLPWGECESIVGMCLASLCVWGTAQGTYLLLYLPTQDTEGISSAECLKALGPGRSSKDLE